METLRLLHGGIHVGTEGSRGTSAQTESHDACQSPAAGSSHRRSESFGDPTNRRRTASRRSAELLPFGQVSRAATVGPGRPWRGSGWTPTRLSFTRGAGG